MRVTQLLTASSVIFGMGAVVSMYMLIAEGVQTGALVAATFLAASGFLLLIVAWRRG